MQPIDHNACGNQGENNGRGPQITSGNTMGRKIRHDELQGKAVQFWKDGDANAPY